MRIAGAARLFLLYAIWRTTGAGSAGRSLINALGEQDETLSAIAATLLARAGESAEPLVLDALRRRENLAVAIPLFGDVARPTQAHELEPLQRDPDPKIARAAKDAMEVLQLRRSGN
jgi:hypothetical protein